MRPGIAYADNMFDYDPSGPDDADADLFDDGEPADTGTDLLGCGECGHMMYAYADHCPRCGAWRTKRQRERRGAWTFAVAIMVVLIVIAIALM